MKKILILIIGIIVSHWSYGQSKTDDSSFKINFPKLNPPSLYIVNGKIFKGKGTPLDTIDPKNISRIEVLTNDQSRSIYGRKAKDGAVIIYLKQ